MVATTNRGSVVEALEEVAWILKRPQGVVVATPIRLSALILKKVVVAILARPVLPETARSGRLEREEVALMERMAYGDDEDMPI